jgi:lipopolysaccharide transport system permease protein
MSTSQEKWDYVIERESAGRFYNLKELISYRDLIILFVKRDFVSLYKQTVLGPLWVILQPVLTTVVFIIVFDKIAKIETGVPSVLFYLIGILVWTYFADCVTKTSETFVSNQNIFGKVYFPRLAVPVSIVLTNLIKLFIQFLLFLAIYIYFIAAGGSTALQVNAFVFLLPFVIVIMALLGMGTGLIIAALTTKYKDLRFLIQFAIQLGMYITPVVYPLNSIGEEHRWILQLNPMAGIVETFKLAFFGEQHAVFSWLNLAYCFGFALLTLLLGVRVFRKVERTFMDTI